MGLGIISRALEAQNAASTADNADAIYARITREQFDNFYRDFGGLENTLINKSQTDTSLIDQAKADAPKVAQITRGIAARNASRYGVGLTPDQLKAQNASITQSGALGASDAINNARFAQKDANNQLLDSLIDIGSGVNATALGQLGSAAQSATARRNAYTQAKAASSANTIGTIGQLGAAAMFIAGL